MDPIRIIAPAYLLFIIYTHLIARMIEWLQRTIPTETRVRADIRTNSKEGRN